MILEGRKDTKKLLKAFEDVENDILDIINENLKKEKYYISDEKEFKNFK